jgi:hypothetical protein
VQPIKNEANRQGKGETKEVEFGADSFYRIQYTAISLAGKSDNSRPSWRNVYGTYLTAENRLSVTKKVDCSAQTIHNLGILHRDLMPCNLLCNEETRQVIVVDFERAECVKLRHVLGAISANRTRKTVYNAGLSRQGENGLSVCMLGLVDEGVFQAANYAYALTSVTAFSLYLIKFSNV